MFFVPSTTLLFVFCFIYSTDGQCFDRPSFQYCQQVKAAAGGFCTNLPANQQALCPISCGTCRPLAVAPPPQNNPPQPPVFARVPTTTPRNIITNNNFNPINNNNNNNNNDKTDSSAALPIWAVVLILVFVVALFVGATILYFCCKQKRKLKKMERNKILLQRTDPSRLQSAQPAVSAWDEGRHESWTNEGYLEDGLASKKSYLASQSQTYNNSQQNWIHNNLNNATSLTRPDNRYSSLSQKNVNAQQSRTVSETMKKKAPAPPPPEDQVYENLPLTLEEQQKKQTRRAPPPPPRTDPDQESSSFYSDGEDEIEQGGLSVPREEEAHQQNADPTSISQPKPPCARPRTLPRMSSAATSTGIQTREEEEASGNRNGSHPERIRSIDSDASTSRDDAQPTYSRDTEATGTISAVGEWMEHLFAQKSELEEYYNRLAGYVETMSIQPADSVSNVGTNDRHLSSDSLYDAAALRRSKSLNPKSRHNSAFPDPPDFVKDEWEYDPQDVKAQTKVVKDLKRKLSELEILLQNAKEFDEVGTDVTMTEATYDTPTSIYSPPPSLPPKDSHFRTMPHKLPSKRDRVRSSNTLPVHQLQRITMKNLLSQLNQLEGENFLAKIDQTLQVSQRHLNTAMNDRSADIAPSTRLARQIHHVMRDVIDPRQQVNIFLAAQATSNLTVKLAKCVVAEQVAMSRRARDDIRDVYERINVLSKQLLQMTVELERNKDAVRKRDIASFIGAFIQNALKIMEASHSYVCVYTNDKKEDHRRTMSNRHKSLESATVPIKDALCSGDLVRLSDGLTKLEELLKLGKLPELESTASASDHYSVPRHTRGGDIDTESTFSCGSDCESTTSCSTCMPHDNGYGSNPVRNPYLFPGGTNGHDRTRSMPASEQKHPFVLPSEMVVENPYMRPSTRPEKVPQRNPPLPPREDTIYPNLRGWMENPADQHYIVNPAQSHVLNREREMESDAHHQLMLAKYLNDLLKSQEAGPPRFSSLPPTPYGIVASSAPEPDLPKSAKNESKPKVSEVNVVRKPIENSEQPKKSKSPNSKAKRESRSKSQPRAAKKSSSKKPEKISKTDRKKNQPQRANVPVGDGGASTELPKKLDEENCGSGDQPDKPEEKPEEDLNDQSNQPLEKQNEKPQNQPDESDEKPNDEPDGQPDDEPDDQSDEPDEKPDEPDEKPDEPGDKPDEEPNEEPHEPDEKPDEPKDKPNEPDNQPDEPNDKPDEPDDKTNEPDVQPDDEPDKEPDDQPDEPDDKPDDSPNEPDEPGNQPEDEPDKEPDAQPDEPDDQPHEPDQQPDDVPDKEPNDQPDEPDDQPDEPDDKPDEPDDKPDEPEDKPDEEPNEEPDEPDDQPDEPDDKPDEPDDKPDEPEDKPDDKPNENSDEPEDKPDELDGKPDEPDNQPGEESDKEPDDQPDEPDDQPDEKPDDESDKEPDDQPNEPEDKPDEPDDKPDEPDEKPDEPGDKPDEPDDTPDESDEKPDETDDQPDEPEDKPDEPDDQPDEPGDKPDEPDEEPDESDDKSDETDDQPDEPDDKPDDKPDDQPDEPEDKPDEPDDQPDEPGDKPDEPDDQPDEPDDIPDESDEKPDETDDQPDEPDDQPDEPEDQPDEPEDQPDEPGDKPDEPDEEPDEPDESDEKPDETDDQPDEPDEKPDDEPDDQPDEPDDKPDEPDDQPDEPDEKPENEPDEKPDSPPTQPKKKAKGFKLPKLFGKKKS